MTRHRLVLVALLLAPTAARAQTTKADSVQAFLETARAATAKYADRNVAIREGFRRVGPEFPAMGEHWVQPGRLASGRFLAAAPPILTYTRINDVMVLSGVAYALPLSGRDSAPHFPERASWHDHGASVDEESLLIGPARGHDHAEMKAATDASAPRLAMLHAWIGQSNPAGVFAQENWALPYLRLGLPAPAQIDTDAARALSLLTGGDTYYRAVFRAAAPLSESELAAIDAELARTIALLRGHAPQTEYLRARWLDLWQRIEHVVTPGNWQELAAFAPMGGHP